MSSQKHGQPCFKVLYNVHNGSKYNQKFSYRKSKAQKSNNPKGFLPTVPWFKYKGNTMM